MSCGKTSVFTWFNWMAVFHHTMTLTLTILWSPDLKEGVSVEGTHTIKFPLVCCSSVLPLQQVGLLLIY